MCHALIIEDDFLAADYLGALAEMSGASSHAIAQTETQAVSLATAQRPAIIVCDLHLSDGCGQRAVRRIVEALGPITVLFVTGHPGDIDGFGEKPSVLAKPFVRDEFIRTFRRLVPSD